MEYKIQPITLLSRPTYETLPDGYNLKKDPRVKFCEEMRNSNIKKMTKEDVDSIFQDLLSSIDESNETIHDCMESNLEQSRKKLKKTIMKNNITNILQKLSENNDKKNQPEESWFDRQLKVLKDDFSKKMDSKTQFFNKEPMFSKLSLLNNIELLSSQFGKETNLRTSSSAEKESSNKNRISLDIKNELRDSSTEKSNFSKLRSSSPFDTLLRSPSSKNRRKRSRSPLKCKYRKVSKSPSDWHRRSDYEEESRSRRYYDRTRSRSNEKNISLVPWYRRSKADKFRVECYSDRKQESDNEVCAKNESKEDLRNYLNKKINKKLETNKFQLQFCKICNIFTNTKIQMTLHSKSKKHKKKLDLLEKFKQNMPLDSIANPQIPLNLKCDVCSMYNFGSINNYNSHMGSQKHARRLVEVMNEGDLDFMNRYVNEVSQNETFTIIKENKTLIIQCDICNVISNSNIQHEFHLKSKKHANNLKTIKKED